jgi:uncharacterized protein
MYVFGSALRDDFRPGEGDIDLLVEFKSLEPYEKAKAYFALRDGLKELLGTNVDLVSAGAIRNRYIAREVDRTKQMLARRRQPRGTRARSTDRDAPEEAPGPAAARTGAGPALNVADPSGCVDRDEALQI